MPEAPQTIGRYEIQRELGRGMMGVVYEATDPALGRKIALKTIQLAFAVSDDDRRAFQDRFLAEARLAAGLSHPGIVVVHDVGQDPVSGTLYIALELLQGRTLEEILREGPMDWRAGLAITRSIAEALRHAHGEGVVHRDIKPANIMILPSGATKIMDFGIAKMEGSQLTAAGQFFGTPLYMSPEQALGRKVDGRSDLFSLGSLAYALLTGQQAFGGANVPQIVTRVVEENPRPPTQVIRTLPRPIDYLVARALAKDPAERYPDAKSLAEDIEDIIEARPPRHQSSWAAPPTAEGTLAPIYRALGREDTGDPVAPAAPPAYLDLDLELTNLIAEPEPRVPSRISTAAPRPQAGAIARPASAVRTRQPPEPPRRDFGRWPLVAVAGLATAAVIIVLLAGRGRPKPTPEPPGTDAAPAPVAAETPAPRPPPPAATDVPGDAPGREIQSSPTIPASVSPGGERAQLEIDFEHSLKGGRLRVWVDDALALEQDLDSRVTRKIASLKLRKGSVEQTLDVPAGRHEVKVEVAWDNSVRTGSIWANFDPGSTRRLSARVGSGIGGLVRKSLDLGWE
jgi:hypothetical protein